MVITLIWTIRFEFCDVMCATGAVCICVPSGRVGRLLVTPWMQRPIATTVSASYINQPNLGNISVVSTDRLSHLPGIRIG